MCWTSESAQSTQPPSTKIEKHSAQLSEEEAILAVARGFLTALNTKSWADFEKYCVRAGGMALSPPGTALRFCTIGSFIEYMSTLKDTIDERIWDPEVRVHGDGDLAAVWAPFRAKVNGFVDHVGVELFVMHRISGEWKVTGMADSCRQPTEEERGME